MVAPQFPDAYWLRASGKLGNLKSQFKIVNSMINKRMLQSRNALAPVMTDVKQAAGFPGISWTLIRHVFCRLSHIYCLMILTPPLTDLASAHSPLVSKYDFMPCLRLSCRNMLPMEIIAYTTPSPWKLVRAKGAKEGESVVSIMRTADTIRSDADFAGLMVRCVAQGNIDVLIVLVTPLPPRSRPQITIAAGTQKRTFEGTMVAAGTAVLLPDEIGSLAGGPWQRLPGLAISIEDGGTEIKGAVALDGLGVAYNNLVSACKP